ncbi:hypothetical protein FRC01_010905, partial [Tulasnella sp. 417]
KGALDLSPSLFKKFAPLSVGVITVKWNAPSSKRSVQEGDIVIRAPTPEDAEIEDDDDFKFDAADAVTAEELAELLGAGDDDDSTEVEATTSA